MIKNVIDFDLFWFISNIQRICFIELSSELGHQFLTEVKKISDSGIFWLGLLNFWIGAWFPFDVFQFIVQYMILNKRNIQKIEKTIYLDSFHYYCFSIMLNGALFDTEEGQFERLYSAQNQMVNGILSLTII